MKKRCVIIGASPETDCIMLSRLLCADDYIVCADGGCRFAEKIGAVPDMIVGDFDSGEKPKNFGGELLVLPVRKNDTDTMFAAREMMKRGFEEIILCGVSGARPDHNFGAYCTLKMLADGGVKASICDGGMTVCVLNCGKHTVSGKNNSGFGMFPFGCAECEVSLDGFDYNADHAFLTAGMTLGSSNRIFSEQATVEVHRGTAIIFIYSE